MGNKIPKYYLNALNYNKLQCLLPYIFVNDIIEIMNEIKQSPILSLIKINKNDQMISYNDENIKHQKIMKHIETDYINKMIWIRDIPKNVSDRKLFETFKQFGNISAITMDRYQSIKEQ